MNFLDFLISYIAIGSAFAMRSYFLHRHRGNLFVFISVLSELLLWLPKWSFRALRKLLSSQVLSDSLPPRGSADDEYLPDNQVEILIELLDSTAIRNRVREAAERYAALRSALIVGEAGRQPNGQFELFDISGHRNGRTGTACLFRKNLAKLRNHSIRSAEALIQASSNGEFTALSSPSRSALADFFLAYDDFDAILKVRIENSPLSIQNASGESARVQVTI